MRQWLVTALFFFGPVLLLFLLRHLGLMLQLWLALRQRETGEAEVIDVTPARPGPPSRWFVALALILGLVTAVLVWHRLRTHDEPGREYVPAHLDESGRLAPGHFRTKRPSE
jgi:hypothetical protein